jgi:DUF1680 family protein
MQTHRLTPLSIQQVTIDDEFWAPKRAIWRDVTIPYCFDQFEREGALDNFDRIRDGRKDRGPRDSKAVAHNGRPWHDGLIYEMIRGCADFLASQRDPVLEARIDGYIERIAAAQAADPAGYLNTYTQTVEPDHRWGMNGGDDNWQHDIYNAGALVEAAVHYYRATGKTRPLEAAARLANHMCDVMGPPPAANVVPGHPLAEEAVVKLYRLFRDEPQLRAQMPVPVDEARYLQLAEFWLDTRGHHEGRTSKHPSWAEYAQDHLPVIEQQTIEGHAVRATLMCTGLLAAGLEDGRPEYFAAASRLWENMTRRRMYITGGVGARYSGEAFGQDYELPNEGYLETCAAIGATFFHHYMNRAFGDARYVDEMERALYNGILCGVSLAGNTFTYVNPLEATGENRRWSWHTCPCCPPMFLKIMGALPTYIYAKGSASFDYAPSDRRRGSAQDASTDEIDNTDQDALYVNLFIGSRATVTLGGAHVEIGQVTRYPWDGTVCLVLNSDQPAAFTLYVRIPAWCDAPRITRDRQPVALDVVNGYARLDGAWQPGATVTLDLPMPARPMVGHPNIAATRGRIALTRGPLVYCLEDADNDGKVTRIALPESTKVATDDRPGLLGGVTVLTGNAIEREPLARSAVARLAQPRLSTTGHSDDGTWPDALYLPAAQAAQTHEVAFTAIPYYANANREPGHMRVWIPACETID